MVEMALKNKGRTVGMQSYNSDDGREKGASDFGMANVCFFFFF